MTKFKSILVCGGAGFYGSSIVDVLVKAGAEKVIVVDNLFLGNLENLQWAQRNGNLIVYREDARYISVLESIIEKEKPEAVINCAVKCLPYGFVDPEGAFTAGVDIAVNLCNLLRKKKFVRLAQVSSSESYGSAEYVPMDEKHPFHPETSYAAGKAAADLIVLSYRNMYNCEATVIRPFNMYGPRQNMAAYAAVIPVTIRRLLTSEKPVLEGDGEQTRDFTYVEDAAEGALALLECDAALGKVVNLGTGKETKIKDLIAMICEHFGYPFEQIKRAPTRPADVRRLCAGIELAKELIGWKPKTDFKAGIEKTSKWFSETMRITSRMTYY
ncbi:MAG: GDP-mannose 4,6-dehydratase [Candidatus Bathyarchaeia archaeon]